MKTPEEIKKDALALIRQTDASYRQLSKVLCDKENATLEEVLQAASQVKVELETVKRERDAAVEDAAMGECCETCLYGDIPVLQNPCMCCYEHNLWKWRGVCPENTEVQNDDH